MKALVSSWRVAGTALLAVAALVTFARACLQMEFYRGQIAARIREQAELRELEAGMAEERAPLEWIESTAREGETLEGLIRRHLAGAKADVSLRETAPVGDAWVSRKYEVRLDPVEPGPLADFLASCENARPPVRLLEIQVTATRQASLLQAQLSLAELVRR